MAKNKKKNIKAAESTTESTTLGRSRTLSEYAGLVARGFVMGSADVVPGVSGGTMAFILGIYEELIESIRAAACAPFWKALIGLRIPEALKAVNAGFLVALLSGILLAVLSLAKGLEWLLINQPVYLWSFFFGLVLASIWTVSMRIPRWSPLLVGAVLVGTVGAYVLVGLVPLQTPESPWFLFLSGALAICAMILPGISGSFVLVLLGKYQYILGAVNQRDFVTVAIVGAGAVIGLVSFAQVLGWLFKRYHDLAVALLTGLMVGSLRKIWPWKEVLASITDRHGAIIPTVEANVLPASFGSEVVFALGLAVAGFVLVLLLDRLANQNEKK